MPVTLHFCLFCCVCFGFLQEADEEYLYLATEMCDFTLEHVITQQQQTEQEQQQPQLHQQLQQLPPLLDNKGIPTAMCMSLLSQLVEGVGHLHAQDVVHNDLKPDNIFLKIHANPATPL